MKIFKKHLHLILFIGLITLLNQPVSGQNGDPPPPPANHGLTNNQPAGGSAPVGSGLVLLIFLGSLYGLKEYKKAVGVKKDF